MPGGVFGASQRHAGSFKADSLRFSIAGNPVAGMILQQVQFNFTQQVNMVYEIGSNNVYYVGGRAQGTGTIGRLVGPPVANSNFIDLLGDICEPKDLTLHADTSACVFVPVAGSTAGASGAGGSRTYSLHGVVLTAIGANVNAQDVMINEQVQYMFTNLEVIGGIGMGLPIGPIV